jgi:hypothetical protein
VISLKESWKNEFPAIEYFSFSGYSLFVVNKKVLSVYIQVEKTFTHLLLNSVQLLHQTALTNTGLIFSHIFQVTCILHDLRFSQHAAQKSRLLAYGTATMGRLFPATVLYP